MENSFLFKIKMENCPCENACGLDHGAKRQNKHPVTTKCTLRTLECVPPWSEPTRNAIASNITPSFSLFFVLNNTQFFSSDCMS